MRALIQLWELALVIVLGVPMIVVGYLGAFVVNGIATGYLLYQKLHRQGEEQ